MQKILKQGDARESTRGKLLHAYKAALTESDAQVTNLANATDFSKRPKSYRDRSLIGWIFWMLLGPHDLAAAITEHKWKPPTLALVRQYFIWLYPGCRNSWPEDDDTRDKVHRTTIIRMGLPLGKDKIGRPPKLKTSP